MVAIPVPREPEWEVYAPAPRTERLRVVDRPPSRRPRLTRGDRVRRRRLTVLIATAVLVIGVGAAAEALATDGQPPSQVPVQPVSSTEEGVYVVQPGDTLWSIARRLAPDADPRPLVEELRSRRGSVELQVGDRIELGDRLVD